jgi:adenosylhomocysteine nucleosidase
MTATDIRFAVLISANAEWIAVKSIFSEARIEKSPYGEYFLTDADGERVLFFHGGWGKVAAAASTQYVIDHFKPSQLINLGTCGGVEGRISRFDTVVADKVVIYDIHEAMGGNPSAGIAHYTTGLELPADTPVPVIRTTLYSADRDLTPAGLRELDRRYRPVAVDWESGAIAWVAKQNGVPILILRGVSDLVSLEHAEAEGNEALFETNAVRVMQGLVGDLPKWIRVLR